MSNLTVQAVTAEWDHAATRPDYQAAIHPSGRTLADYEASGSAACDDLLNIVDRLGAPPADELAWAEFGCGDGRILRHFYRLEVPIVGIDASSEMLAHLQAVCPGVPMYLWDGLGLDLDLSAEPHRRGRLFDVIYSVAVFIHQSHADGARILENLSRLLRPGGVLLVDIPIYDVARERAGWTDVSVWTLEQLSMACHAAGLAPLQVWTNPGAFSYDAVGANHHRFQVLRKP